MRNGGAFLTIPGAVTLENGDPRARIVAQIRARMRSIRVLGSWIGRLTGMTYRSTILFPSLALGTIIRFHHYSYCVENPGRRPFQHDCTSSRQRYYGRLQAGNHCAPTVAGSNSRARARGGCTTPIHILFNLSGVPRFYCHRRNAPHLIVLCKRLIFRSYYLLTTS